MKELLKRSSKRSEESSTESVELFQIPRGWLIVNDPGAVSGLDTELRDPEIYTVSPWVVDYFTAKLRAAPRNKGKTKRTFKRYAPNLVSRMLSFVLRVKRLILF